MADSRRRKMVGTRRIYNDRPLMFMERNRARECFAEGRARGLHHALETATRAWGRRERPRRTKHACPNSCADRGDRKWTAIQAIKANSLLISIS
ncbi:hypothetical protein D2V17_06680 [Aurantiacibacter xanthus]|uniref:Uncharacterized protein n=1 Tax=Aurantiacibacter xanthus TaxID=1784712 RepID=A0A3A1P8N8_9SPHN|nr:hypothetical protein D2V17_06680 [Aurantiacibacter xanthus]